ncbi:MAG: TonB-dependent receptor plug domain-containing protein [Desulfobacter sp.]|nr:MAG: TonB-dependent receptor plug domain-containing protein [Desulfobacter sp.]
MLSVLFLVLLGSGITLAGETPGKEDITQLGPITVTAERNQAQGTEVVDTDTIQSPRVSGNLIDSLGTLPGVQLKRSGTFGTGTGLRLRGFDETRLIILKDGVNINRDGSYGNGAVDWSSFGLESAEQIQIYRGSCPARYGNTLGGVIDIKGIAPSPSPAGKVSLSYGSLGTLSAGASHSGKNGALGWAVSAGHFETDGYLINNFSDRDSGSAQLTFDIFKGWTLGAGAEISQTENGNPVYNRPNSPFYDSSYPEADERELRGPGISSRLLDGPLAWGKES